MPSHRSIQAPAAVVMVRPHRFTPDPETAADNTFQSEAAQGQARAMHDRRHPPVHTPSQLKETSR